MPSSTTSDLLSSLNNLNLPESILQELNRLQQSISDGREYHYGNILIVSIEDDTIIMNGHMMFDMIRHLVSLPTEHAAREYGPALANIYGLSDEDSLEIGRAFQQVLKASIVDPDLLGDSVSINGPQVTIISTTDEDLERLVEEESFEGPVLSGITHLLAKF